MDPSKVKGTASNNNTAMASATMSASTNNDSVELKMSVTSIKRVDPYVKEILAKSTHVALYRFNPAQNEWEKTETEGALFLYSRSGEPLHSIMIMNRLNTNNLIEPIVREFEYQLQAPFLLYRNSKNKIFGIWFYNREECVNITMILESLMDSLKEKNEQLSNSSKNANNSTSVDIFSMLTRAQEDYNKTPIKNEEDMQHRFSSTPRAPPDVTSQSVMDFFAKAGVKGSSTVPKNISSVVLAQGQSVQPQVQTPGGNNILQRLMSNPAHSVEHIEKQQRSVTPKQQDQQMVILRKHPNENVKKCLPINTKNYPNTNKSISNDNGINFIHLQSPTNLQQHNAAISSPLAQFLKQPALTPLNSSNLMYNSTSNAHETVSPLALLLETPQKQSLMPPMMFATSSSKLEDVVRCGSPSELVNVEPLTKNQLLQAINYLLMHDNDFITKLHEAYVKSLTEKMSAPIRGVERHCNNNPTSLI